MWNQHKNQMVIKHEQQFIGTIKNIIREGEELELRPIMKRLHSEEWNEETGCLKIGRFFKIEVLKRRTSVQKPNGWDKEAVSNTTTWKAPLVPIAHNFEGKGKREEVENLDERPVYAQGSEQANAESKICVVSVVYGQRSGETEDDVNGFGFGCESYVHESPVLSSIDDLEYEPGEEKTSEEEKLDKSRAFGIEICLPSGENATPNEDKCAIEVVKLVFCIFCPTLLNSLKWKRN
nr:uncharacterized protein LOC109185182 [Ipomoea batatas]